MLRPEAVEVLQQEPFTPCYVLDLFLLIAGDPVVVLGRRHFLELVKSQKASIKLSVSRLHVVHIGVVVSWAEPILFFRFFVPLEGQSFLGPIQFDLFIVKRGLLAFSNCSVCIA